MSTMASGGQHLSAAFAAGRAKSEALVTSLINAARVVEEAHPNKVTPRASIILLAEEKHRTCLLTGDAAEEDILEGLDAAGRITDGRFSCNVVKVQHHGSEFNLSRTFTETVLADHYVFCGDGAHDNPDPSLVRTIVEPAWRTTLGPSPSGSTARQSGLRRASRRPWRRPSA